MGHFIWSRSKLKHPKMKTIMKSILTIVLIWMYTIDLNECWFGSNGRQETREKYVADRKKILKLENIMQTGGAAHLTEREYVVNQKLVALKQKEIEQYRNNEDGKDFP